MQRASSKATGLARYHSSPPRLVRVQHSLLPTNAPTSLIQVGAGLRTQPMSNAASLGSRDALIRCCRIQEVAPLPSCPARAPRALPPVLKPIRHP